MRLTFGPLATAAAAVCAALASTWLFVPEVLPGIWGVAYSDEAGVVPRRGAALFLGIGVMFALARDAEPSPARSALCTGFAVACLALAALGVFEPARGRAALGILSAVAVELALACALLAVLRNGKGFFRKMNTDAGVA